MKNNLFTKKLLKAFFAEYKITNDIEAYFKETVYFGIKVLIRAVLQEVFRDDKK